MNIYDSNIISGKLKDRNYQKTENIYQADIIVIQTCSVRQNAEDKVINRLQFIQSLKKKKPSIKIIISGCLAEHRKEKFIKNYSFIDLVCGPQEYFQIENFLDKKQKNHKPSNDCYDDWNQDLSIQKGNAYIAITRGCNNYCSYCIVPYLRGPEISRSIDSILNEINSLDKEKFKEITLLGQNVNSYQYENYDFTQLIIAVAENTSFKRIRFLTSHPKDLSYQLIYAIRDYNEICNHIHLPFQSGSNTILKKMNRKYTREHYIDLIREIKNNIPEAALTTDIIVGFPGETEEDFQDTLSLIEQVQFEDAYMYKYSLREGTKAAAWQDTLTEEEKINRLNKLIDKQLSISREVLKKRIGSIMEVLVEGVSKKNHLELIGRSKESLMTAFPGTKKDLNKVLKIKIKNVKGKTLWGERIDE